MPTQSNSNRTLVKQWGKYHRNTDSDQEWASSDLLYLLLPPVYGACHTAAWNYTFWTSIERGLWRISLLIIVSFTTPCTLLAMTTRNRSENRPVYYASKTFLKEILGKASYAFVVKVSFSHFGAGLFAARGFLMVESFLSIRDLSEGSYKTTPCEDYLPHL